jgi:hypothetical protein
MSSIICSNCNQKSTKKAYYNNQLTGLCYECDEAIQHEGHDPKYSKTCNGCNKSCCLKEDCNEFSQECVICDKIYCSMNCSEHLHSCVWCAISLCDGCAKSGYESNNKVCHNCELNEEYIKKHKTIES